MVKYKKDKLSAVLLAIGDPTRRAILEKISRGEPSVLEIADSFHISLPAISRHLKVLERAGLISRKKEGRMHRFKLTALPMKDASEWIRSYERFWRVQLGSLETYLEETQKEERSYEEKKRRKKPLCKTR